MRRDAERDAATAMPQMTLVSRCEAIENGMGGDALLPITPGDWPTVLHPGKPVIMHATIPTYRLYGIEALPTNVIVGPRGVRVVKRGTGRPLVDVKHELDSCMQADVQVCTPILGRREPAPRL
jgi:hypothetical protein